MCDRKRYCALSIRHKLIPRIKCFGGVHKAWATAHLHVHAKNIGNFFTGCAKLDQAFDVKSDAGFTAGGNSDAKGHQLFGLEVKNPVITRPARQCCKAFGDFWTGFVERLQL